MKKFLIDINSKIRKFLTREQAIVVGILFYILLSNISISGWHAEMLISIIILSLMLISAFKIVEYVHKVSEILGEPYGTIILTIAVTSIEIGIILTSILNGHGSFNVIKDTAFSIVMLSINGFAGISLFIGGLKYNRQRYNLEGAHVYIAILSVLMTICLILPNYISSANVGTFNKTQSIFVSIICLISYFALLFKQTISHPDFFIDLKEEEERIELIEKETSVLIYNIGLATIGLIVMISLSKHLSIYLNRLIISMNWPEKLSGLIIAGLVLTPEGVSAILAASKNKLQKSINHCLGSAVATISLTVPILLLINSIFMPEDSIIYLGLNPIEQMLAILTVFTASLTFSAKQTSTSYGMLLLSILLIYFMTILT